jgi:hypothetical protein
VQRPQVDAIGFRPHHPLGEGHESQGAHEA